MGSGTGSSFSGGSTASSMDPAFFLGVVGGVSWVFVGLVFLAIGIVLLRGRHRSQHACTATTMGVVSDITSRATHNGVVFSPLFEYEVDGLKYIKSSPVSSSKINYAIGEPVEVRYNPNDPHEHYLPRDTSGKTLAIVLTLVGVACLIIGALWVFFFLVMPQS